MSARDYALDYSALDRGWATQGAADYCDSNGHATHRVDGVDGVDTGICPRCLTVTEFEDQGYSEWIDLLESEVYVNAEARVHRDFSSQSGVAGFVGVSKGQKTPEQEDVRECAGCEDSENAPHESDCTRVCGTRYGYDIEGKPVVCDLSVGHAGSHLDRTHSAPAQFYWESV